MTQEQQMLASMNVGDEYAGNPLLPGLTEEPVVLRMVEKKTDDFVFEAKYMGVYLGLIAVVFRNGQMDVEEL